ncbi:MAG: peptidyl-prolyl cis-trans isomerase [Lysobacter sp.]|nr:peptidyl-prolyl cis-trans isomerase [Lysobacter sp.]
MLQKLREKSSGWLAIAIVSVLIVPFALFGLDQYVVQRGDTYAARIQAPPTWWTSAPSWWPVSMAWDTQEISSDDFRERLEQSRQQQRAAEGAAFDNKAFESVDNKRRILDQMIDERVMRMAADRNGIAIGDAAVIETIQGLPEFQVDGKFDPQRYQLSLASLVPARTPVQFQQLVRESLQQSILAGRIAESSFVTKSELDRLLAMLGERRDVAFTLLPAPATDVGAVSADESQRWYKTHLREYRAPESVSIEYIELSAANLPGGAVDEAELLARYEKDKAKFVEGEQRLASHILIKVDPKADAAALKAAEQKATQLVVQARQAGAAPGSEPGASFAALARANSDDTGSKASGGDLGWISRDGSLVKPFEDALFAMQSGDITGPVKTDFGYHVIQLRELKAGQPMAFEQAREQMLRESGEADRERAFNALAGRLVDLVYKNPNSLAAAAQELNLQMQNAGPFTRGGGSGILVNPAVQRAAFSDTLIQDGTVSDPIEIAPNHTVLIRVKQHQPARAQTLAEVSDRVIAAVRGDRRDKAAQAAADTLLGRLNKGETLQAIATSQQLAVSNVPNIPRGAPVPSQQANEAFFSVPRPAAGKVSTGKVKLDDGTYVVFAISKVQPGDLTSMPAEQRTMLQQQFMQVNGQEAAESYVSALRNQMKAIVAEDRL